jgi:hypothetical protein
MTSLANSSFYPFGFESPSLAHKKIKSENAKIQFYFFWLVCFFVFQFCDVVKLEIIDKKV